jgi:hypothetical protein
VATGVTPSYWVWFVLANWFIPGLIVFILHSLARIVLKLAAQFKGFGEMTADSKGRAVRYEGATTRFDHKHREASQPEVAVAQPPVMPPAEARIGSSLRNRNLAVESKLDATY